MKLIFEKFILIKRLKQSIVMPVTVVWPNVISAQCSECQSEEIQPCTGKQWQTVWTKIRPDNFGPDQSIADPGFFVGKVGGVGGPGPTARKQPWQRFLVINLFYSLQRGLNGFISEKTILFQGFRAGPTFSRWGPAISRWWGPNANFYRNPYNL